MKNEVQSELIKSWQAQKYSLWRVISLLRVPPILCMENLSTQTSVLLRVLRSLLLRVQTIHFLLKEVQSKLAIRDSAIV